MIRICYIYIMPLGTYIVAVDGKAGSHDEQSYARISTQQGKLPDMARSYRRWTRGLEDADICRDFIVEGSILQDQVRLRTRNKLSL